MQKKIMKVLILYLVIMMVILCVGCANKNSKKATGVLEDDPEYLYEKTVAEVKNINENSYFFGYNLLDVPPEGTIIGLPTPLKDVGDDIGISPGDDIKVISDKLDGTSFIQGESYFENKIRYEAYHIILDFAIGKDGRIDEIGIFIYDPTEELAA